MMRVLCCYGSYIMSEHKGEKMLKCYGVLTLDEAETDGFQERFSVPIHHKHQEQSVPLASIITFSDSKTRPSQCEHTINVTSDLSIS